MQKKREELIHARVVANKSNECVYCRIEMVYMVTLL